MTDYENNFLNICQKLKKYTIPYVSQTARNNDWMIKGNLLRIEIEYFGNSIRIAKSLKITNRQSNAKHGIESNRPKGPWALGPMGPWAQGPKHWGDIDNFITKHG